MDGCVDGRIDWQMNGLMDGWMNVLNVPIYSSGRLFYIIFGHAYPAYW